MWRYWYKRNSKKNFQKIRVVLFFDFGCYFPYSDPDKKLIFEFSVTASQDDTK